MKRCLSSLLLFAYTLISCNLNNKDKIVISSRYQDYRIDEKSAKEEVLRNGNYNLKMIHKNTPIDFTWLLPNPIIDGIKDGEFMLLIYRSSGCFHQETQSIIFKKMGSKIYGILPGKLVVELTVGQIDKIRKFESNLFQINNNSNYCTTVHSYRFYLGNRLRTYIDDTCGEDIEPFSSIVSNFMLMGIPVE
jgi:hypothetical protein